MGSQPLDGPEDLAVRAGEVQHFAAGRLTNARQGQRYHAVPIVVFRQVAAIVDLLQLHAVVIDHAVGGDHPSAALDEVQGLLRPIQRLVFLFGRRTAVECQTMVFSDLFQVGEVGDYCGLLTAECEIDEVFDVGQAQGGRHGLELDDLVIIEAVQPFGQVVQLVHVDGLTRQAVQDGDGKEGFVYPAVLGCGVADAQAVQQLNGGIVLVIRDGEGDGGRAVFRVALVTEYHFESQWDHSLSKFQRRDGAGWVSKKGRKKSAVPSALMANGRRGML